MLKKYSLFLHVLQSINFISESLRIKVLNDGGFNGIDF